MQPIAASLSASPDWLALLAEHGEAAIAAIAIATRRPVDWVAGLDLDEAVRLAEAVFGVNADFYPAPVAERDAGSGADRSGTGNPTPGAMPPTPDRRRARLRRHSDYTLAQTDAFLAPSTGRSPGNWRISCR